MDLTKIIYNNDITFDWYAILDSFHLTEKSELNPRIYSIKGLADLAISVCDEPGLSIHPGDARTIEKVCSLLSQAVSKYYNTNAKVALCRDGRHFLQVEF